MIGEHKHIFDHEETHCVDCGMSIHDIDLQKQLSELEKKFDIVKSIEEAFTRQHDAIESLEAETSRLLGRSEAGYQTSINLTNEILQLESVLKQRYDLLLRLKRAFERHLEEGAGGNTKLSIKEAIKDHRKGIAKIDKEIEEEVNEKYKGMPPQWFEIRQAQPMQEPTTDVELPIKYWLEPLYEKGYDDAKSLYKEEFVKDLILLDNWIIENIQDRERLKEQLYKIIEKWQKRVEEQEK